MKKYILLVLFWTNALMAMPLEINQDHSKLLFDIDYMKLTTVQGQFKKYSGTFNLSTSEREISDVLITIVSDSVDTNEAKRDFHLKGHEFFLVSTYPTIEFKSTIPATINNDKKFKLKGVLTLRGIKKEVALDGIYKGKIIDPWKKENYFFELEGKINRQDFGMTWNKELDTGGYLVGDEVRLKISVQTQALGDKTAFSTHMIPSTKGIVERDQLKKGKIKKLSTSTDPNDHKN